MPTPKPKAKERRIEDRQEGGIVVVDSNGHFVAKTYAMPEAQKIAAVDDLLDALYSALPFVEDADPKYYRKGFPAQMVKRIKAAIAKAEGK